MSQTNFEEFKSDIEKGADAVQDGTLFNRVMEDGKGVLSQIGAAGIASPALGGIKVGERAGDDLRKALGLPHVDVTGFDQEAPYHSQGLIKDALHGVKHLFSKDESLDDKIRKHVEDKMTPAEHKKFEAENKALEEYHQKVIEWGTKMMLNPGPYPEMPDTPMHQEIGRRAEQAEKAITDKVKGQMSPTDLKRLDAQLLDYKEKFDDATKIHNPYGTGDGFRPLPQPGNAIKDYYDRISEATEAYLKS